MWKNVFIEATLMSVVIFGGFYFNSAFLKREIAGSQEKIMLEQMVQSSARPVHFSGKLFLNPNPGVWANISGHPFTAKTAPSISGVKQYPGKKIKQSHVSGNKA
jgi:hypothetical protein